MPRLGRLVALIAAFSIPLSTTAQACGPGSQTVLLMLDASYSMLRMISRTSSPTRFNVAREALVGIIDRFPQDGWLALRFYGSQSTVVRADCRDTVLAVPFAPARTNGPAIKLALAQAHAHGVTPMSLALEQAIKDFDGAPKDRRIVIVTDGGESCDGNPCTTAVAMAEQGFVIDALGFLLVDAVAREQLRCVARVTHGTYVDARTPVELQDRLSDLLSECLITSAPRADDAAIPFTEFMG